MCQRGQASVALIATVPALIIVTLGVAYFFVNVLMLLLTEAIVSDFVVDGFWTLVGGALLIWAVNMVVHAVVEPDRWNGRKRRQALSR
jgi:uncharacterized membrane protein YvlD (DUF360 family)